MKEIKTWTLKVALRPSGVLLVFHGEKSPTAGTARACGSSSSLN